MKKILTAAVFVIGSASGGETAAVAKSDMKAKSCKISVKAVSTSKGIVVTTEKDGKVTTKTIKPDQNGVCKYEAKEAPKDGKAVSTVKVVINGKTVDCHSLNINDLKVDIKKAIEDIRGRLESARPKSNSDL